jgi:hypothetical protein
MNRSEDYFRKLALLLTQTRNICQHQHGDASKSWEYPFRVIRAVFSVGKFKVSGPNNLLLTTSLSRMQVGCSSWLSFGVTS